MRKSIVTVMLLAAVAACGGDKGTSSGSVTGGTMIINQPIEGSDFFPPYVVDNAGRLVQDLVFDRLAEISDDLATVGDKTFTPRLAKSWTWAPDSLSIAFVIDPNAKWHDGKPVTAADVRYSLKAYTDTSIGSSVASSMGNIDSVHVQDSSTAVVWFKRHTPEQFYDFVYQAPILPAHIYENIPAKTLRTSDEAKHPIGTGRFRFTKWEPGVRLELTADTANYRGRPKLDRVVIVKTDPATSMAQVLSGQADFMEQFAIDQAAQLDSNKNVRGQIVALMAYGFLGMNLHAPKSKTAPHPVFSDVRVRRALSMAVDRAALLKNVFGDKGVASHGPFVSTLSWADTGLKLIPFDTVGAKALLDSAGWKAGPDGVRVKAGKPLRFSILTSTSSTVRMRYSVLIQEQFRKVGAQVDLDQVDFNTFRPRYFASDFDATVTLYGADPSPTSLIQSWGTAGIGQQNALAYSDKRVDALLDSAVHVFDRMKQRQYAAGAVQQIIDDAPGIWLYDGTSLDAINRRFVTQPMRADGWWSKLADWSVPPDKRIDRDRIGLNPAKP